MQFGFWFFFAEQKTKITSIIWTLFYSFSCCSLSLFCYFFLTFTARNSLFHNTSTRLLHQSQQEFRKIDIYRWSKHNEVPALKLFQVNNNATSWLSKRNWYFSSALKTLFSTFRFSRSYRTTTWNFLDFSVVEKRQKLSLQEEEKRKRNFRLIQFLRRFFASYLAVGARSLTFTRLNRLVEIGNSFKEIKSFFFLLSVWNKNGRIWLSCVLVGRLVCVRIEYIEHYFVLLLLRVVFSLVNVLSYSFSAFVRLCLCCMRCDEVWRANIFFFFLFLCSPFLFRIRWCFCTHESTQVNGVRLRIDNYRGKKLIEAKDSFLFIGSLSVRVSRHIKVFDNEIVAVYRESRLQLERHQRWLVSF